MGPERLPGNQLGDDKVQIDDAIVDDLGAIPTNKTSHRRAQINRFSKSGSEFRVWFAD